MGVVHADITLRNAQDVENAAAGLIREKDIRQVRVRALVDTGAGNLVLTPEVHKKLGLRIIGLRRSTFANGTQET
jgi:predicted aspartyl protease